VNDPSFKQANGNIFSITGNGNYLGGGYPYHLSYDGHLGFDYRTTDQEPATGRINVLAAAPGVVHWITGSLYNTIEIDHGNGYTTRYLHLYSRQSGLDGISVNRGQVIGVSGDTGSPGSPHLHFEVRVNGVATDPYGWAGVGTDPYKAATNVESVNLWNESAQNTYLITPLSRVHGPSSESGTFTVTAGSGCAWTATPTTTWITITSGNSGSGTGAIAYSVSANTSSSIRTGAINVQGTAFTITQAGAAVVGDRIYGIDVSSVGQGVITPTKWTQVKASGVSFAWIRSSKGNANSEGDCRFLDPKFYDNIQNAKSAGLKVGAYHVGNIVQYSAIEEASFFVSVAGVAIKPGNLRPVLDLESHSCGDPASLGVDALSTWVIQWATEVQRLTAVSPIIYCNQAFLVNLSPLVAQQFDLWVARFTDNPESTVSVAPWNDWAVFQYSQNGSVGGIAPVDLNVFKGKSEDFDNRFVIPPPLLTGIGGSLSSGSGQFQVEVSAPSQQQVIMQASDDLVSWTDIGAVIMINGKATFTDPDTALHPTRFYRPKP
jgi:GH25 family lysozyme M1 (1,4-beta-N-acetylmuramidase)